MYPCIHVHTCYHQYIITTCAHSYKTEKLPCYWQLRSKLGLGVFEVAKNENTEQVSYVRFCCLDRIALTLNLKGVKGYFSSEFQTTNAVYCSLPLQGNHRGRRLKQLVFYIHNLEHRKENACVLSVQLGLSTLRQSRDRCCPLSAWVFLSQLKQSRQPTDIPRGQPIYTTPH